jgi:hypothetical protein
MLGGVFVMRARDELVALYETTGRAAEAQPIVKALDIPFVAGDPNPPRQSAAEQDSRITQLIRDSTVTPGLRWEMVTRFAAFKPCTELREIVFGPGPQYHERFAAARKALVRTPGDDALMRVAERTLETRIPDERLHGSIAQRSLLGFARTVDALTGSRRMTFCTSFLAGMVDP